MTQIFLKSPQKPRPGTRSKADKGGLKLLVFDTSFTLEMIRDRQLERSLTCRDLNGFFDHVWTVHPFATLLTSDQWGPRHGTADEHKIAARHTMIEGRVGRFGWLKRFVLPNFLIGQAVLFLRLHSLIRREKISVIRVSSPLYLGLFGLALARSTGIPLVIRVGGNYDQIFEMTGSAIEPRLMRSRRIEKMVERFVFPRADLIAGANQDNLDFALANGARLERSTIFRYGNLIDPRHFVDPASRTGDPDFLTSLGIEPGQYLLYIGRLEPVKQPDHVVEALAEARRRGFDVKAVLAGDGSMRAALAEKAEKLGLAEHLVIAGNLGQNRLAELIPLAAVIVSPHTGRALSEAALAGAPVVAYDIDWQRELIETDRTGILVPNRASHDMADAVARFLADPAFARRMGAALRRKALAVLDPPTLDAHEKLEYLRLFARFDAPSRPESACPL